MRTRILILGLCIAASAGSIAAWHAEHALPRYSQTAVTAAGAGRGRKSAGFRRADRAGRHRQRGAVQRGASARAGDRNDRQDRLHRGTDRASRQPDRAARSAAVPGGPAAGRGALARDSANLVAAQANLGRYATLLKQGFATPQQVSDQRRNSQWAAGGHRRRQGSDLQCPDAARLHHDHLADRRRDRHQTRSISATSCSRLHHADRHNHPDPADIGRVHAAAGGCARGAEGDGRGQVAAIAYDQNGHTKLDEGTLLLVNNTVSQARRRPAQSHIPQRQSNPLARRVRQRAADPRPAAQRRSQSRWTPCSRGKRPAGLCRRANGMVQQRV